MPVDRSRRKAIRLGGAAIGAASLGSLAGCTGDGGTGGEEPSDRVQIHTMGTEGALYIPVFFLGRENNFWQERGIDLTLEITGFGKFTRAFTANLSNLTTFPTLSGVQNINQDEDIVYIGPHMNLINATFVRADSDIESVDDLRGRRLGVPFETSTTTTTNQAMLQEIEGFDIWNDTEETIATAPPSLWNLLVEQEEIDAMITFTGFTLRAYANPDLVREIFNPVDVWEGETGFPPPVNSVVARRSFVEENPAATLGWLDAWNEAVDHFRDNVDRGIEQYGALAGLSDEAEIAVVKEQVSQGRIFPQTWGDEFISSKWQLFDFVQRAGGVEAVPDQNQYALTRSEIEEMT